MDKLYVPTKYGVSAHNLLIEELKIKDSFVTTQLSQTKKHAKYTFPIRKHKNKIL
ncbi:hypothetical protein [Bacillus cereus]|uniref:hypothetical protein n=1 Tax=Bacillus cereus TaxID=1396 RepID=UPI0015D4FBF3|nr:hypothetical protein [Bacillus cereus]